MSYLNKFLAESMEKLTDNENLICIGTEACDPDSFISMLVVSIAESAIPVVNMSKLLFEHKKEMLYLCNLLDIDLENLIFIENPYGNTLYEQLDKRYLVGKYKSYRVSDMCLELILVDHHVAIDNMRRYPVRLIIDHHILLDKLMADKIVLNTLVASCCTLVFHQYFYKLKYNPEIASLMKMLALVICFDSGNLNNNFDHQDVIAYNCILEFYSISKKDLDSHYSELLKLSREEIDLPNKIILLKDFKRYKCSTLTYGISTVKLPLSAWIKREEEKVKRVCSADIMLSALEILARCEMYYSCLSGNSDNLYERERIYDITKANDIKLTRLDAVQGSDFIVDIEKRTAREQIIKCLREAEEELGCLNEKLKEINVSVAEVIEIYKSVKRLENEESVSLLNTYLEQINTIYNEALNTDSSYLKVIASPTRKYKGLSEFKKAIELEFRNILTKISFEKIFNEMLLEFGNDINLDFLILNFVPTNTDNQRHLLILGNKNIHDQITNISKSIKRYEGFEVLEVASDLNRKKLVNFVNSCIQKI